MTWRDHTTVDPKGLPWESVHHRHKGATNGNPRQLGVRIVRQDWMRDRSLEATPPLPQRRCGRTSTLRNLSKEKSCWRPA